MFKNKQLKRFIFVVSCLQLVLAQPPQKTTYAESIKSIVFKNQSSKIQFPIVKLGERFQLHFDDLNGDERNYYYKIKHFNHDWTPSILFQNEYLKGFDNLRIENYQTSFNTLQPFTHYQIDLPNEQVEFLVSGNYLLEIYNEGNEMVFSRKFVIYEDGATVNASVFRTRDLKYYQTYQSVQFSVSPPKGEYFRDPENQLHITILQNEQWNTSLNHLKPQYNMGSRLEYRYDAESRFEGGNEYLFFSTKNIQVTSANVSMVELNRLYESYLTTNFLRRGYPYSFNQDLNGDFVIQTLQGSENGDIEADYSWVHFSLYAPVILKDQEIYIYGKFNNYELKEENKMYYNPSLEIYEGVMLLKQGIYNYKFVAKTPQSELLNGICGSHALTENRYLILVYYRYFGNQHDSLIGLGETSSFEIID
ncbi:MAG: DUF5103 domain-containing protein, partial [Flavobacteriaceae bacterium]|jgi:hypothetical protein|nr:DUF5103 domain-containing protein [Flavobacteriaceae bacterium]